MVMTIEATTTTDTSVPIQQPAELGRHSLASPPTAGTVPASHRRECGFALLIVLWVLGLLALLGSHFAAAGRAETALARNQRAAAAVEAATAGAIQQEIFELVQSPENTSRDIGASRQVHAGATLVSLDVEDETSRLNPNIAQAAELGALLEQVGADARSAASIAAAILDWRTDGTLPRPGGAKAPQYHAAGLSYGPPGSAFLSVTELGLVLGMTPTLLDRVRPHLTVFTELDPNGGSSDPFVARALQAITPAGSAPQVGDAGAIAVVRITAVGHQPDNATVMLRAVVRLNATSDGPPFEILSWQRLAG
jgi:general secretion pathway protein K